MKAIITGMLHSSAKSNPGLKTGVSAAGQSSLGFRVPLEGQLFISSITLFKWPVLLLPANKKKKKTAFGCKRWKSNWRVEVILLTPVSSQ